MAQAVVREVTESVRLPVSPEWLDVGDDVACGLLWWVLVAVMVEQRGRGEVMALSPLRNVEIHICRDVDDAENLRAALGGLGDGANSVIEATKASLINRAPDVAPAIAVCVFTYDELKSLSPAGPGTGEES